MAMHILPACRTADGLGYEYREYEWGDVISGSKEVLQRMGIGLGVDFPGEPSGPMRQMNTVDSRGFPCTIKRSYDWEQFPYSVYIAHPGRAYRDPAKEWHESFPGVQRQEFGFVDYFKGSAEALTAAGIVPAGMFPGMPGMRSVRVTILADGSLPAGHRNANHDGFGRECAGAKIIEKAGKCNYLVQVTVASDLGDKRLAASRADRQAWADRMAVMPRAPRLDGAIRGELNELAKQQRSALRVVWSRPKFIPGFNILPQGPFAR